MRQRIVSVAITAVTVALVLFAVPLAVVVQQVLFGQAQLELERSALRAAARVGPDFAAGDQVELPPETTRTVGIYDPELRLRAGDGPSVGDQAVRQAARGSITQITVDHTLVIAVPVASAETVIAVARASVPTWVIWSQVMVAWLVLAGLAVAALAVAALVARRQARLLSKPLESLAAVSQQITSGDFAARVEPSEIPEVQRVADTQNAMLNALTELLHRERIFSTQASHQLRTPLTALQLGLERALDQATLTASDQREALTEATEQITQLHRTVDDLLHAARAGPESWLKAKPATLDMVLAQTRNIWHGALAERGRQLAVEATAEADTAAVPGRPVIQIMNVLIDNALSHGSGTVTIRARIIAGATAVDVIDEGDLSMSQDEIFSRHRHGETGQGQGIGLPLARSIAEACGGRLLLAAHSPTRFTLVVPEADLPADHDQRS